MNKVLGEEIRGLAKGKQERLPVYIPAEYLFNKWSISNITTII
jgi:hypothetical protein